MDKQAIFDKGLAQFRAQGCKSLSTELDNNSTQAYCRYRGIRPGSACFIGASIPDSVYDPRIENMTIDLLLSQVDTATSTITYESHVGRYVTLALNPGLIALFADWAPHLAFLNKLQKVHDGRSFEEIEVAAAEFAELHGLTYTPPGA
jgi:hypothetical protein